VFGVYGKSDSREGRGVFGEARAASGQTQGVYGVTWSSSDETAGVYGLAADEDGRTYGVQGQTKSSFRGASGVYGKAAASSGTTYGVQGLTVSQAEGAAGVYGEAALSAGKAAGVYGRSDSPEGFGGYFENTADLEYFRDHAALYAKSANGYGLICDGYARFKRGLNVDGAVDMGHLMLWGNVDPGPRPSDSFMGRTATIKAAGVYSHTPTVWIENDRGGYGVRVVMNTNKNYCEGDDITPCRWEPSAVHAISIGTYGSAGYFESMDFTNPLPAMSVVNSGTGPAAYFFSQGDGVRIVANGRTGLEVSGGTKSAVVDTSQGDRRLYSEEATEVWFSDYGFGQLEAGLATIKIDSLYAETVNLDEPYHVFVQPYGDAELYVTGRNSDSFQVHLRDGEDQVRFSYRVVAKRRGFEDTRLELSVRPDELNDRP
jgi:hypothetical protein